MEVIESPEEFESFWSGLNKSECSLPENLRPPQRDALFHIRNQHVLLCVGTGLVNLALIAFGHRVIYFLRKSQFSKVYWIYPLLVLITVFTYFTLIKNIFWVSIKP